MQSTGQALMHSQTARPFDAAFGIEGYDGPSGQRCQALDALRAAGRAAVDVGLRAGDGLGVGVAVGVAAARALRLRQQRIDAPGQCVGGAHRAIMR
jgi:hypothetical protein